MKTNIGPKNYSFKKNITNFLDKEMDEQCVKLTGLINLSIIIILTFISMFSSISTL